MAIAQQPSSNPIESGGLSKNDIVDLLSEETEPVVEKEIEEKPEDDEKPEEEKEDEIELEEGKPEEEEKLEPTEDDLELVTPPRRKEILAAYPDIFKKFPYMEKAMYREQKYTELLPTIQDAQEAVEAKENLQRFEAELLGGKTDTILKQVKEVDEKAFGKIVDDYLPALARIDRQAYLHVIGNVAKGFAYNMAQQAQQLQNDDLKSAAHLFYQFIFGQSEYTAPATFAKQDDKNPEKEQLDKERKEFAQERFTLVRDDLQTRTENVLKSTIANHIDPKGLMTDYVKKVAIKDAMEDLQNLIEQDSRFQTVKDKLWERAFKSNFSKQSTDAIRSAYLEKAKTHLRDVIKKSRTTALEGLGKRASQREDESPLPVGRTAVPRKISNNGNERSQGGKDNPSRGKRTLDYFNED